MRASCVIDYSKAKELPGVVEIITADDVPNNRGVIGLTIADCGVLAKDKVRYIGDAVAAVRLLARKLPRGIGTDRCRV